MRKVIDQNFLRNPKLRDYLAISRSNQVLITDMGIFESLKGNDPAYVARQSYAIISEFPSQVYCSGCAGEMMRKEIIKSNWTKSICDGALTRDFRQLLKSLLESKSSKKKFPISSKVIVHKLSAERATRANGALNKDIFMSCYKQVKKAIPPEVLEDVENDIHSLRRFAFIVHECFACLKKVLNKETTHAKTVTVFTNYSLVTRHHYAFILCLLYWLRYGGIESKGVDDFTNIFADLDYIIMATYCDGVMSKDKMVNALYRQICELMYSRPAP
jgi:hypothetical protein